ncbi:DNA polymerase zeta catalytic subunit, partial [Stegodyphus mimosarum]
MFSLRIVTVDSYQAFPVRGYDICYSDFRGSEIYKVPVIRVFGVTPAGQKGCIHVHGVFPYLSVKYKDVFPDADAKSSRKYMQELTLDIDKSLNVAARNASSHRHHVYKIIITK